MLRRRPRTGTAADLLVVGLGNPGEQYAGTRHNVGAEVVELLAGRHGARLRSSRERARVAEVQVAGKRVALAVPTSFMNDSGVAVGALVRRHGVEPAQVCVISDDLDLPVGKIRLRAAGGTGGHRGLSSIAAHLGGETGFVRLRIGIGRPPGSQDPTDYVLRRFGSGDRALVDVTLEEAADAVEAVVADGVEAAMNRYN